MLGFAVRRHLSPLADCQLLKLGVQELVVEVKRELFCKPAGKWPSWKHSGHTAQPADMQCPAVSVPRIAGRALKAHVSDATTAVPEYDAASCSDTESWSSKARRRKPRVNRRAKARQRMVDFQVAVARAGQTESFLDSIAESLGESGLDDVASLPDEVAAHMCWDSCAMSSHGSDDSSLQDEGPSQEYIQIMREIEEARDRNRTAASLPSCQSRQASQPKLSPSELAACSQSDLQRLIDEKVERAIGKRRDHSSTCGGPGG